MKTEEGKPNEEHVEKVKDATEKNSEEALEKVETAEEEKAEEAKPPAKEEMIEEEIIEERFYTIPLGKAWIVPPNKRAPKAIRIIRDFIKRHMKLEAKRGNEEEEETPRRVIIS
ncbi:MAG: hypothetical protein QW734_04220, partial [Candidatus Bathyarchaeia archaeon]